MDNDLLDKTRTGSSLVNLANIMQDIGVLCSLVVFRLYWISTDANKFKDLISLFFVRTSKILILEGTVFPGSCFMYLVRSLKESKGHNCKMLYQLFTIT